MQLIIMDIYNDVYDIVHNACTDTPGREELELMSDLLQHAANTAYKIHIASICKKLQAIY